MATRAAASAQSTTSGSYPVLAFRNISITAKLAAAFGALLVIMAVMGAIAVWRLNAVAAKSHEIARGWLPSVALLGAMNTAKAELRVKQIRLAIATTDE